MKQATVFPILLFCIAAFIAGVEQAEAQGSVDTDREALVALYDATDGDNWNDNTNWKSDKPLDQWYGIYTDGNGRVRWIDILNNKLTGSIPVELGNLTNLESLALNNNQLTGEIPVELGNLTNLESLSLDNNQLTGEIPVGLGNLTNLFALWLRGNQLTGEIPVELENLTNLRYLYLANNQLTGNLPIGLCHIENRSFNGNISLIVNCFGVPDEFVDNERKHFEITQNIHLGIKRNVEFILIQENSYGKLWLSDEAFHSYSISAESMNELSKYVFSSTPADSQKGILEYSTDLLGNLRKNYEHGNNGERIIDILWHVYDWGTEGLAFPFHNSISIQTDLRSTKIVKGIAGIIAHEYVHSINFSYARNSDFFLEGLAEWASDIIFDRKIVSSYVIYNWDLQYRDLPLFPPRPFFYPHANLFVAYIADRVGVENMKHIIQICQPGGVCDADNPDNGDWYDGIDGLDYALSLLDPDFNLMNIVLDFHTTNLVNDSSVNLNGVSYGYEPIIYTHPNFGIKPDVIVDFVNSNSSLNTIKLRSGGVDYIAYQNTSNLHFAIDTSNKQLTSLRLFKEKGDTKELVNIDRNVDEYTVFGDYDRITLIAVHANPRPDQPDLTLNISATQNYGVSNESDELPTAFSLEQNYPNPFNPSTSIGWSQPQAAKVRLSVYNMLGQKVATLVDDFRPAGVHEVRLDALNWTSGVYVYVLEAGAKTFTQRMVLLK